MKKTLVLAEKPSVGRDIARVLSCNKKNNGYFENEKYIVTWALGHLITLATPEKYKKEYENWSLENLPMIPNPFKLEVIKNTQKQYYQVKKLLERDDVSVIVIATDAGREGELVARWIIDYARCKKPIKRLWISSVTDKAIKDGFKNLVDGRKYNSLYQAAKARAEADWIVGLNGTRALTCKHNASLSMGRVQTPTLGLVYEREEAIRKFVSKAYYEIEANIGGINSRVYDEKSNQSRFFNKEEAEGIYKACQNKKAKIKAISHKEKSSYKTGFYDLTELQREANKLFGFSAKETLNIMQGLYERHKVLTYPRTDSKYITKDIVATLPERVRSCKSGWNKEIVASILKKPIVANQSFVNDAKVGDHHGIIPTEVSASLCDFSLKEQKIYNLVIQRFLAVLLPPYKYEEIILEADINGNLFKGKGTRDIDLGWKIVYQKDDNKSMNSKETGLKNGEFVDPKALKLSSGKTMPPGYLTEGELLHQMEKSGLGTVATRADIIEKIVDHQYVDKANQHLRITKTGRQLLELVPEDIKSKELTAKWEKDLELISKGKKTEKEFIDDMIGFTKKIIHEIKLDKSEFKHENVSTEKCPECGKKMLIKKNKFGKSLVCSDRQCGYKKNLSKVSNARCPNCHKKMELVGDGDNKKFVCSCGHKEKLESFNKRKSTSKNVMGKKEAQRYMKKSEKNEESFNNPFADLLKDMDN